MMMMETAVVVVVVLAGGGGIDDEDFVDNDNDHDDTDVSFEDCPRSGSHLDWGGPMTVEEKVMRSR